MDQERLEERECGEEWSEGICLISTNSLFDLWFLREEGNFGIFD